MQNLIIFDLDGTLADGGHRAHLIPSDKSRTEHWTEFNMACLDDTVVQQTALIYDGMREWVNDSPNHRFVFLTARSDECKELTKEWLTKHGFHGELIMRSRHDHRPSEDFKEEILDILEERGDKIYMAFDDDVLVTEMMRKRGIYAIHVYEWWKY